MQHIHTYIRFWNPRYRFCNRAIFYLNLYFLTLTFLYTSNFVSIFTPISVLPFSHYRIIECAVLLFWVRTCSFLWARKYFLITEFVAFSVRDHLANRPIYESFYGQNEENEKGDNSIVSLGLLDESFYGQKWRKLKISIIIIASLRNSRMVPHT